MDEYQHNKERRRGRLVMCLLVALFLAGLGVRIFGAWCYQHRTWADNTRIALMAKHMAEGTDFPVFVYGQNYMGSLEPAVDAVMCFLFGTSGFAVNLGSALLGFLILPVVYSWGRDTGGRVAGLAALMYCIIGPAEYFMRLGSSDCNAVILTTSTFILWFTGRIAFKEATRCEVPGWQYACLGLVAGFAWWASQLISATLFTAAIVLTVSLRLRVFKGRIVLAGLMFFLGSAPWWIWNACHGWGTMDFRNAIGATSLADGCRLLTGWTLELLSCAPPWTVSDILSLLVYGAALVAAAIGLIGSFLRRRSSLAGYHLATIILFLLVFSAIYSRSFFAQVRTARYLLPLVTPLAVLIGVFIARLPVRPVLALVPVFFLVATHALPLPVIFRSGMKSDRKWTDAASLADFCARQKIDVVFGDYWEHWINFASGERCCFCSLGREPYSPYARRGELASAWGVVDSIGQEDRLIDFDNFVRKTASAESVTNIGRLRLHYDVEPTIGYQPLLSTGMIVSVMGMNGSNAAVVLDENMGSSWSAYVTSEQENTLEFEFASPVNIAGIRLLCRDGSYPNMCSIEGRKPSGGEWILLKPPFWRTLYFWSGSRVFWSGPFYRDEYGLSSEQALDRLRIHFTTDSSQNNFVNIGEIQILTPSLSSREPGGISTDSLISLIDAHGVQRLYADRWVSSRVFDAAKGRITCTVPSAMTRTVYSVSDSDRPGFAVVEKLTDTTAFLAPVQEAGVTRRTLARRHVAMRETETGPWVLFDFAPGMWKPVYGDIPFDCTWTGTSLMTGTDPLSAKREAVWLYALAGDKYRANPQDPETVALLEQAVEAYPAFALPHRELISVLSGSGRTEDADRYTAAHKALTMPEIYAPVAFTNGVQLLGICPAVDGRRVTLEWRWKCPPGLETDNLVTFVHFIGEAKDQVFQDDHPFMWSVPPESLRFQPLEEVFSVVREFTIPDNVPPGRYRVIAGLYDPSTGLRVKPVTRLPVEDDAVEIPFAIEVQP